MALMSVSNVGVRPWGSCSFYFTSFCNKIWQRMSIIFRTSNNKRHYVMQDKVWLTMWVTDFVLAWISEVQQVTVIWCVVDVCGPFRPPVSVRLVNHSSFRYMCEDERPHALCKKKLKGQNAQINGGVMSARSGFHVLVSNLLNCHSLLPQIARIIQLENGKGWVSLQGWWAWGKINGNHLRDPA